jgi:DNA-directed RNA polymerase specialized sigma24 family protein
MSQGYVIPVDPAELASRFPSHNPQDEDDGLGEEFEGTDISTEEMSAFFADGDYESRIAPLLDRIPEREADLIYLYFIQRKRQADIASIFGVTQAAISYRLDRGIQRIKFLLSIPQVTDEELRHDLPEVFPTKTACPKCELQVRADCPVCKGEGKILIDVEILVGMWGTTCQSEVAKKLGLTQGRVRHRFFTAVKVLEKASGENERFTPYHRIFSSISNKHFNVLREVKLPQWQDRGGDECI